MYSFNFYAQKCPQCIMYYKWCSCMIGSRLRPVYLLGGVDHSKTVAKLQRPQNGSEDSHYQSACYLLWEERLIFRQGRPNE